MTATGNELWKISGTAAGIVLVKDINPGSGGSNPSGLVNLNGVLLFNADDGSGSGNELWRSDGTDAGTTLVKDINPGSGGSGDAGGVVINNDTLIFSAFTTSQGSELWRTDGTEAGTSLIKEIRSGTASSSPSSLRKIGNSVYFAANDGTLGSELWVTDGSEAGTALVKDINPGGTGSSIDLLTNVNGTLFFQADDGVHGTELWKSDGTEAGTQMILDLVPGGGSPGLFRSELLAVNDLLFFTALVPGAVRNDSILYVTDGTAPGTVPVFTVIGHGSSTVQITDLEFTGKHLFFRVPLEVNPATGARSNYELFAIQIVPEPATASLLALAGAAVALQGRCLRRQVGIKRR